MRINRSIGLIIFLLAAHVLLRGIFGAVSNAAIATMQTVETASQTATVHMIKAQ